MAKITQPATIILDQKDMAAILTEELCAYNALASLMVNTVVANEYGDFVLNLLPNPKEETE